MLTVISYSLSLLSVVSSLLASLNSLIPLPKPLINSGIFLPPNSSKMATTIKTICHGPNAKNILLEIIRSNLEYKVNNLSLIISVVSLTLVAINSGITLF